MLGLNKYQAKESEGLSSSATNGRLSGTHLLLPLAAGLLGRDQGLVVGAAFGREVDLGQRTLHQRHRQVHPLDVQSANEVARFVHALHFNLHLVEGK